MSYQSVVKQSPKWAIGLAGSLTLLSVLADCRSIVIIDDWGPSAGYTLVTGLVSTATGTPARGAEVTLSRCSSPVGGFLASALTDNAGRYRLLGALPPIGFPGLLDTLEVRCDVFVNRTLVPSGPVSLRFAADSQNAPHTTLDVPAP